MDGIWDFLKNLISGLVDSAFYGCYDKMHEKLTNSFMGFEEKLDDAFNIIVSGSDMNSHLGATAQIVNDAITPVAYAILACGFVWELYSIWLRKQDNIDFVDIVKISVKLLIIKSLIPVTPFFLDVIRNTVSPIYTNIITDSSISFSGVSGNIASTILHDEVTLGNFFWNFLNYAGGWVISKVMWLVSLYVYVIAYLRDFELSMLNAMSAIPIIFAVYGETKDVPKRFLFAYATVVLQGLLIIIVFILYNSMLVADAGEGLTQMITATAIAGFAIAKTNQWAGKILGQH